MCQVPNGFICTLTQKIYLGHYKEINLILECKNPHFCGPATIIEKENLFMLYLDVLLFVFIQANLFVLNIWLN